MDNTKIANSLTNTTYLEKVVLEYERKTGISRKNIFDFDGEKMFSKKSVPSVTKLLLPIVESINSGCKSLNKKSFSFTSSELSHISNHVKEIIDSRDGDSKDRIISKISESITWKANNACRNLNEVKYWTKGFFTRKTKNNLALNLYHYERDLEANPYSRKPKEVSLSTKKVSQKKSNRGTEVDWDKMDEIYKV
jgi:hypothetical protein